MLLVMLRKVPGVVRLTKFKNEFKTEFETKFENELETELIKLPGVLK